MQMCCRERAEQKEIVLPTLRGLRKCRMEDIVYAETWDRGVRLTLIDGQEQVNYCMSELKGMLPEERFIMCHRAFLANIGYVRYVRGRELELTTGCVLPVSKHRLHNVRKRLMR